MSQYFVYRLIPPRPTFPLDITEDEQAIMARHAQYWARLMEAGSVLIYGPVQERGGSFGLGVIESDSEAEVRALAAEDPAVLSGLCTVAIGTMLRAFVR